MTYMLLDTETTGLNCYNGAILQIAGMVIKNGRVVEKFDYRAKPFRGAKIEVNSALCKKYTRTQEQMYGDFISMLDKHVDKFNKSDKAFMIAYNAKFDEGYIRRFFERNNNKFYGSYFWNPSIDLMQLAARKLVLKRRSMKDFKLSTVCKKFGIKITDSKLHNAVYDTDISYKLFKKVW